MAVSTRLTTLTRVGFAARGLLYIVIAFLVIGSGRTEDPSGALTYLAKGGGRVLLIVMTLGFVAYGLWRLSDAAFNIERHGPGKEEIGGRLGALGSGVAHMLLAWQAVRLIQGTGSGSGGNRAQEGAQTALGLPGGQTMLLIAGLVLIGVGVLQFVKAAKGSFCDKLDRQVANEPWVRRTGQAGYAARGLVFVITGFFLFKAGLAEQASKAGGMPEALAWLTSPWDVIVALGLALFGVFSLIEARYRIIQDVPVDGLASRARAAIPR